MPKSVYRNCARRGFFGSSRDPEKPQLDPEKPLRDPEKPHPQYAFTSLIRPRLDPLKNCVGYNLNAYSDDFEQLTLRIAQSSISESLLEADAFNSAALVRRMCLP